MNDLLNFRAIVVLLLVLPVSLFAPPVRAAGERAYAPVCERLSLIQHGKRIQPRQGILHVAPQPFRIVYHGAGHEPALAVSASPQLNFRLERLGRKTLWTSMGAFMAHDPDDLIIDDVVEFHSDEPSRDGFAALIGEGYPQLLRSLVVRYPHLDSAASISMNAGFKLAPGGGSSSYVVKTINSLPLAGSNIRELHLTYFAVVGKYAPAYRGSSRSAFPLLARVLWGSCILSFDGGDAPP